ncbi:MAG: DNA polymerase III subunit delta [Planctomycetes bacterium]|nr:DNA polymerase III subunit delta [Planctomycetota bacterium]
MPKAFPALQYLRKPEDLPVAPIYAVYGDEDYLRRRALGVLCEQLKKRGLEIKRVHDLDTIAPLLDELRSPNMFGGAAAFVVSNRREGPRHEASSRFKEEFAAYLEKPGKRNVLVFDAATWQRNLTVPKRLEEHFPTVVAEELRPWDYAAWDQIAQMQAGVHGLTLERDALAALKDAVGSSLARAETEIAKLALLAKGKTIKAADVAFACGYEGNDVTFALCDAIITGDSKTALLHASKMAGKAETGSILSFLGLLRFQIATLGRVALALAQGAAEQTALASAPRLREALKPRVLKVAKGLNRSRLGQALAVLLAADEEMKSAAPDPAALLISVVHRLCETLHASQTNTVSVR